MTIIGCIVGEHNLSLVLLAAVVCLFGCVAAVGLVDRAVGRSGLERAGWLFLASVGAGSSIWCTHFVAILAYDAQTPVSFDVVLTISSLMVAVVGVAIALSFALSGWTRHAPAIGGAMVGLAVSAMHYVGMLAYRPAGLVTWNVSYVVLSVALAAALAALALDVVLRRTVRRHRAAGVGALVASILSLHFTGMAAYGVMPLRVDDAVSNPDALRALALAIAGMAVVIVATGVVSFLIDDKVRADAYGKLRQLAMYDGLTGLPNRLNFNDELEREIRRADARRGEFALIAIDLRRFSEINDNFGHVIGDEVLKTIARRLTAQASGQEFIARIGGDEFMAICRQQTPEGVAAFVGRLNGAVCEPMRLSRGDFDVGASLGVAVYPRDGSDQEALVSNADLAMSLAKADPAANVRHYRSSMGEAVRTRRKLASDLHGAIHDEQLEIHYQVQRSVVTDEVVGYEALLRWRHPERGYVPPDEFIPLAEENGLIVALGAWVLRAACAQAATWAEPHKVAVNLSPVQIANANLPKLVHEVLFQTGLPAARLELELTETAIVADKMRTLDTLRRVRALGVTVALDDFGTGYSSLDTLRAFPFDKIKLDRSFMREIDGSPQAIAILRAVLALGRSLGIPVLAEGIETRAQLTILEAEGCDEAQGYWFGRPASLRQHVASGAIRVFDEAALAPAA